MENTTIMTTRLLFTLAGIVMALSGGVIWLVGDDNAVTGDNRMDLHSSAVWGRVLDYKSTEEKDYADAEALKKKGETQKTSGIALAASGLAVFSLRFTARPSAKKV